MTKRDTVILAVLFNVVVLACVLATAQQVSYKKNSSELERPVVKEESVSLQPQQEPQEPQPVAYDEIDKLLEEYMSVSTERSVPKQASEPVKASQAVATPKNSAPSNPSDFYIVRPGDNPWTIAKKFDISFENLLVLNNLNNENAFVRCRCISYLV